RAGDHGREGHVDGGRRGGRALRGLRRLLGGQGKGKGSEENGERGARESRHGGSFLAMPPGNGHESAAALTARGSSAAGLGQLPRPVRQRGELLADDLA